MSDDVQGCTSCTFDEVIKDAMGDFVAVIVKSGQKSGLLGDREEKCIGCGGNCCFHEGNLCQVGRDFLLLLDDGTKTYIPFKAIAALIKYD